MGNKGIKLLTGLASAITLTTFMLLAYFLERPIKENKQFKITYDTSIINESSTLTAENSFVYSLEQEEMLFSLFLESHSPIVNLGSYISHDYLYNVSGSPINDINITWNVSLPSIKLSSVLFSLVDMGTHEVLVVDSTSYTLFTSDNGFVTSIKSTEDIYLYSIDIIFTK